MLGADFYNDIAVLNVPPIHGYTPEPLQIAPPGTPITPDAPMLVPGQNQYAPGILNTLDTSYPNTREDLVYINSTIGGTSGSPVLDNQYRVLGVHHHGGTGEGRGAFYPKLQQVLDDIAAGTADKGMLRDLAPYNLYAWMHGRPGLRGFEVGDDWEQLIDQSNIRWPTLRSGRDADMSDQAYIERYAQQLLLERWDDEGDDEYSDYYQNFRALRDDFWDEDLDEATYAFEDEADWVRNLVRENLITIQSRIKALDVDPKFHLDPNIILAEHIAGEAAYHQIVKQGRLESLRMHGQSNQLMPTGIARLTDHDEYIYFSHGPLLRTQPMHQPAYGFAADPEELVMVHGARVGPDQLLLYEDDYARIAFDMGILTDEMLEWLGIPAGTTDYAFAEPGLLTPDMIAQMDTQLRPDLPPGFGRRSVSDYLEEAFFDEMANIYGGLDSQYHTGREAMEYLDRGLQYPEVEIAVPNSLMLRDIPRLIHAGTFKENPAYQGSQLSRYDSPSVTDEDLADFSLQHQLAQFNLRSGRDQFDPITGMKLTPSEIQRRAHTKRQMTWGDTKWAFDTGELQRLLDYQSNLQAQHIPKDMQIRGSYGMPLGMDPVTFYQSLLKDDPSTPHKFLHSTVGQNLLTDELAYINKQVEFMQKLEGAIAHVSVHIDEPEYHYTLKRTVKDWYPRGTGFFIDDTHLLTNLHLLIGTTWDKGKPFSNKFAIARPGEAPSVVSDMPIEAYSAIDDLALLTLPEPPPWKVTGVKPHTGVLPKEAIGLAFHGYRHGNVIGISNQQGLGHLMPGLVRKSLKWDEKTIGGFSGSPLFSPEGKVIGVNRGSHRGHGLAAPISRVQQMLGLRGSTSMPPRTIRSLIEDESISRALYDFYQSDPSIERLFDKRTFRSGRDENFAQTTAQIMERFQRDMRAIATESTTRTDATIAALESGITDILTPQTREPDAPPPTLLEQINTRQGHRLFSDHVMSPLQSSLSRSAFEDTLRTGSLMSKQAYIDAYGQPPEGGYQQLTDVLSRQHESIFFSQGRKYRHLGPGTNHYGFIYDTEELIRNYDAYMTQDLLTKYGDRIDPFIRNAFQLTPAEQEQLNLNRRHADDASKIEQWDVRHLFSPERLPVAQDAFRAFTKDLRDEHYVTGDAAVARIGQGIEEVLVPGSLPVHRARFLIKDGLAVENPDWSGPPTFRSGRDPAMRALLNNHIPDRRFSEHVLSLGRQENQFDAYQQMLEDGYIFSRKAYETRHGAGASGYQQMTDVLTRQYENVFLSLGSQYRTYNHPAYGAIFDTEELIRNYDARLQHDFLGSYIMKLLPFARDYGLSRDEEEKIMRYKGEDSYRKDTIYELFEPQRLQELQELFLAYTQHVREGNIFRGDAAIAQMVHPSEGRRSPDELLVPDRLPLHRAPYLVNMGSVIDNPQWSGPPTYRSGRDDSALREQLFEGDPRFAEHMFITPAMSDAGQQIFEQVMQDGELVSRAIYRQRHGLEPTTGYTPPTDILTRQDENIFLSRGRFYRSPRHAQGVRLLLRDGRTIP